jgi:hypothetical protein
LIEPDGAILCEWCNTAFNPRSQRGRRPRFCRGSHRVRACERRRGLLRAGSPPIRQTLPAPQRAGVVGVQPMFPVHRFGHEQGTRTMVAFEAFSRLRIHRVRVTGLPHGLDADDPGLVPSLCGTMVKAVGNPVQTGSGWLRCRACERLAHLHPVDPRWWDAMTQRTAGLLMDDFGSTVLSVGQAVAGVRDPVETLRRVEAELRRLGKALGLPEPLAPSLHHRSVAPR